LKKKVFGVSFGIITFLHSIKPFAMGFMEIKPQLGSTFFFKIIVEEITLNVINHQND
jgi:hypothetical protein